MAIREALSQIYNEGLKAQNTKELLIPINFDTKVVLGHILKKVINYTHITEEQIKSKSREMDIVKARVIYFFMALAYTKKRYVDIAGFINKPHDVIVYFRKKYGDVDIYKKEIENEIQHIMPGFKYQMVYRKKAYKM